MVIGPLFDGLLNEGLVVLTRIFIICRFGQDKYYECLVRSYLLSTVYVYARDETREGIGSYEPDNGL